MQKIVWRNQIDESEYASDDEYLELLINVRKLKTFSLIFSFKNGSAIVSSCNTAYLIDRFQRKRLYGILHEDDIDKDTVFSIGYAD